LLREAGLDSLVGDPRLSQLARFRDPEPTYEILAESMVAQTSAAWMEFCRIHRIPACEVATIDEIVQSWPIAEHPVVGGYRLAPFQARFDRTPSSVHRPAPLIGEHTHEVLASLGIGAEEISSLEARGILRADSGTA
jgi:crotonobetainyl-CoA:carnitine CoA-transferase CaiB-like acyl-CoA transferase